MAVNYSIASNEEYETTTALSCNTTPIVFVFERFILVSIIGTSIAILSIVENIFLCFMLFGKKSYRSSHLLYLALLAFFDVWVSIAYIPLMSLNLTVDYMESVSLLRIWFAYMLPMITISHIAMTASTFLMVAASFERYCVTVKPEWSKFLNKYRLSIAALSILLGVLTKFTQVLELEVNYKVGCEDTMAEWSVDQTVLASNPIYIWWRIWFRSIFTILVPFFLLAFMNTRIVFVIQKVEFQFLSAQKLSEAKRKSRVRAATRTLVFIVFTYLLSNVLNVVVIIWEYIDQESLYEEKFTTFYTFAVDLVSLMTILASALRLPIYVTCQSELRKDFIAQIKRFCYSSGGYKVSKMNALQQLEEIDNGDEERGPYAGLFFQLGKVLIVDTKNGDLSHSCKMAQTERLL